MVRFNAEIRKFQQQGEKTGWTYILIPAEVAEQLNPGSRKGFRVKGRLDKLLVSALALLPMGGGDFIIPLNGKMRKKLGKGKGDKIQLEMALDDNPDPVPMPEDFEACLADEPDAKTFFYQMPRSHQRYYIKWINSAKTEQTRVKRITQAVIGLAQKHLYGEMIRSLKD
jgi:hypothetical protein